MSDVIYELLDFETANLVDEFDSEADALRAVRHVVTLHGRAQAATLSLASMDENGDGEHIAAGEALIELAFQGKPAVP